MHRIFSYYFNVIKEKQEVFLFLIDEQMQKNLCKCTSSIVALPNKRKWRFMFRAEKVWRHYVLSGAYRVGDWD